MTSTSAKPLMAVLRSCWNGVGPFDERYRCEVPTLGITAVGRNAVLDLCRALVAAGVPDQPMTVVGDTGRPRLEIATIHGAARWTVVENASEGPKFRRYQPYPSGMRIAPVAVEQKQGVKAGAATLVAPDASPPSSAATATARNGEAGQ